MILVLDSSGVEATTKEMALSFVSVIEVLRVRPEEPLHPDAEVWPRRSYHEMDVRIEQAVRQARPLVALYCPPHPSYERRSIDVVGDDGRAGVTFRDRMMDAPWDIFSRAPSHEYRMALRSANRETSLPGMSCVGASWDLTPDLTPQVSV